MALAYLMKNIDTSKMGLHMDLTAFVVDHQAREGSHIEAQKVKGWLHDIGRFQIPSQSA